VPAVYAMYGGRGKGLYVAYVGIADRLKRRVIQHLITRDSSVATGTSATGLNPDYVTEVRWWEHPHFTHRHVLEAAEFVAFDVLNPILRSRRKMSKRAKRLYDNENFHEETRSLLLSQPKGRLVVQSFQDLVTKITELDRRVTQLEGSSRKP